MSFASAIALGGIEVFLYLRYVQRVNEGRERDKRQTTSRIIKEIKTE